MEVNRREFRAAVLVAMKEAREKVAHLDTDDADNWHASLREAFVAINGVSGLVLNAMNAEAIQRNRERASQRRG